MARLLTCLSRPSTLPPSRWLTTLPVPRAPPCRSASPASRATRLERLSLHSRVPCYPRINSALLCAFPATPKAAFAARVSLCPSWFVQDGEFCARYDKFNVTVPIPKIFHHMSFEAEEVAKELTKKIKAEEDAKEMAKKSAASKRATVATTKKKKPANDTKTTEQTTAPAPAPAKMKDAPVTRPQSDSGPTTACSPDLPSIARRRTALRASAPSCSLDSLGSLLSSTSRSSPRRHSPSRRAPAC